MSYQPESPLLRLPVEVRLEIYQHLWTIPWEKKHLVRRCAYKLKATYLKAQLSAICTLGAICRTIHYEAYAEYFHTTQTYLSGYVNPDLEIYLGDNDRKALELIQNSYLLKTQTRHVCLRWVHVDHLKDTLEEQLEEELEVWEIDNLERTNTNLNIVMNCLKTRFQNAITLDIVCDEICFNGITTNYYDDRDSERIRSLRFRNLEKAVVRTCLTDPDGVKWFNEENLAWFQRLKEDVATLGAPRKEGQEERSYRFTNHIGGLDLNWPRFDRI
ncbi:hypothetical protein B0H65DRAFT_552761 [Neurospora tetraspora]|uniref:F-box domain-containing protein n=1 Tax=Neurospora tetraspora TaxID=94610 RepID=A0AAE0J835_9PEZI|nr:hypothetical protein B0H65DRAFT_552761 [Neurospora tetraspora]